MMFRPMKKLKEIDELEVKESIGAELNADQQMKVAARGGVEAEIERWGGSQDLEQLALAQRKREARERLDAREAEEAGCFQTRGLSVHAALCVKAMRTSATQPLCVSKPCRVASVHAEVAKARGWPTHRQQ